MAWAFPLRAMGLPRSPVDEAILHGDGVSVSPERVAGKPWPLASVEQFYFQLLFRQREKRIRLAIVTTSAPTVQPLDQADADQEIITQVLAGSKDAFGVLIQRYSDPLYRHALGMTGSPDVAEDILQASFIKAYQHLGEVRGRFDAWVFRIVANSCKDWLKNIRRTHVSYEEDDQPSSFSTPEEEMDRNELRTDLEYALARLPESLREAFVMKHVEGRSYEEMAVLLDTTVGALKMRVHRARESLQALLEEKYA